MTESVITKHLWTLDDEGSRIPDAEPETIGIIDEHNTLLVEQLSSVSFIVFRHRSDPHQIEVYHNLIDGENETVPAGEKGTYEYLTTIYKISHAKNDRHKPSP